MVPGPRDEIGAPKHAFCFFRLQSGCVHCPSDVIRHPRTTMPLWRVVFATWLADLPTHPSLLINLAVCAV